jgi:uncharacterized membrane protein YuzA (DUF378 family)
MKNIGMVAWWLVVIGALNWGLVGAFNMDLVMMIFRSMPQLATVVYVLVGLSGVWVLLQHFEVV